MFLPSDKAAVQVNQSAAGFPQFLAGLLESCQHPMTPRIEAEPILEFLPSGEMHTGRKVAIGRPFRNHCINTTRSLYRPHFPAAKSLAIRCLVISPGLPMFPNPALSPLRPVKRRRRDWQYLQTWLQIARKTLLTDWGTGSSTTSSAKHGRNTEANYLYAVETIDGAVSNALPALRMCDRRRGGRSRLQFDDVANCGITLQPTLVHPGQH
jgi:hypothetical protein